MNPMQKVILWTGIIGALLALFARYPTRTWEPPITRERVFFAVCLVTIGGLLTAAKAPRK